MFPHQVSVSHQIIAGEEISMLLKNFKTLNEKPLVPKFIQEIDKSKSVLNNGKKQTNKHKTIKESSPGRLRYSVAF